MSTPPHVPPGSGPAGHRLLAEFSHLRLDTTDLDPDEAAARILTM